MAYTGQLPGFGWGRCGRPPAFAAADCFQVSHGHFRLIFDPIRRRVCEPRHHEASPSIGSRDSSTSDTARRLHRIVIAKGSRSDCYLLSTLGAAAAFDVYGLSAYVGQYGHTGLVMERLLFDRKAMRFCAGVWGAAWVLVAGALLLPLGFEAPGRGDLLVHFLLFSAMAFATLAFSRRPGQLACLALATLVGATALEFAQGLVPYRTFDPFDGVANGAGALAGYIAALLVLQYVIRPAAPRYGGAAP